ncbi:LysR substrate binding domain-containing protein [Phaeovulum vinaykumarii]|uniref:LysR substrate binding domain-containing protein n=2 Tax=Phaeovulum vinaykumarii TaxID=407234 RepID=A0A1N7N199_9RHOB|nr:LysR substrate binding domain-containing protein [Phaeovulum vinaykumarii]SOC17874.1 LysR substrate binding domain-containing protein [Phaeovulum vinaykumarii]
MDLHPDVTVELVLSDGYVDIVGQGLDLAIRFGALKNSSLMVRKLGDNRRVICAAPSYIEKHGCPGTPDDLAVHNCLVMQFGPVIDREWSFVIDGKKCDIMVSGNRTANSGAQIRRWCLDSRGIALKSIWDVRDDLESGRLVELLKDFAPESQSALQIVYSRGSGSVSRIRAFIEFLVAKL